jgi:hypothetical protein
MKIEGSGSTSGSGSISQRHGSVDPDPQQNVMDPQQWMLRRSLGLENPLFSLSEVPKDGTLVGKWPPVVLPGVNLLFS